MSSHWLDILIALSVGVGAAAPREVVFQEEFVGVAGLQVEWDRPLKRAHEVTSRR